ncbi:MAG TPA: hypothetical protein VGN61_13390 [Verrucomicrobiae bacterium]|jgi:hypothetical protein
MSSFKPIIACILCGIATTALAQDQDSLDRAKEKLGTKLQEQATRAPTIALMTSADRNFILAFDASICGLRSDAWFGVVKNGWDSYLQQLIKETGVSYKQANDLLQKVRGDVGAEFGEPPAVCAKLVNSPVMDVLDGIEYKLTGGYH